MKLLGSSKPKKEAILKRIENVLEEGRFATEANLNEEEKIILNKIK
jgi:hypothetical protein